MIIEKLTVGPLATNCYILEDEARGEAVVIDPGAEPEKIVKALERDKLAVKAIINTHGHFDHTSANDTLAKATGAEIYLHQDDLEAEKSPEKSLAFFFGEKAPSILHRKPLTEGRIIEIGKIRAKVIHTPGHTKGSICLLVEDALFTGDLLFARSVGRTDLPGGSHKTLLKSLQKIALLPDGLKVYPGHGEETTLGEEKKLNPYLIELRLKTED